MAAFVPGPMASCPSSPLLDEGDVFCETREDWSLALTFNADGDFMRSGERLGPLWEHLPT